jgi:carbon-monoxide dehydrogenase small subunit
MLIAARDLVLRLERADERNIRMGLSGNLCRCTGYVGIVRAVRAVIEQRRRRGILPIAGAGRALLGPVGSGHGNGTGAPQIARPVLNAAPEDQAQSEGVSAADIPDFVPSKVFAEHFTIAAPPNRVFDLFGDVGLIAACLPGASLTSAPTPDRVEGVIRVKLGPVSADFHGIARIARDHASRSGRIVGLGKEQRGRSSTQGEIRYLLVPVEQGTATRVELTIGYSLQGMLARIARDGLLRDLARRLTADFARNLERQLSDTTGRVLAKRTRPLDGAALMLDLLGACLRRIIRIAWNRRT